MDYIGPRGIPLSEFEGWDELDQEAALAWQRRQQETHSCGVHPDVWDPERGGDLGNLHMAARHCAACEYVEAQTPAFEKGKLPGMYQVWEFGGE